MTNKEKWTLGGIGVIALAALWWLSRGNAGAVAVAQQAPPSYLGYNQPWGSLSSQTLAGLPGIGALAGGSPSCGCSGNTGMNNTLFADTSQLVDYYNSTVAGFASSALDRLKSAYSGLFASPQAIAESNAASQVL